MNHSAELQARLARLKESCRRVHNYPFEHFLCPILHRDEPVELCEAHLLNKAFHETSRRWTVQRKDVDNWFGINFEGDFTSLKYQGLSVDEIITHEAASKAFEVQLTYNGQKIKNYRPRTRVPDHHTRVELDVGTISIPLAIKFEPNEMLRTRSEDWQVAVEKDLRLPALVSLLKAAHLTLFDILGYEYAFSAGGMFLGKTILGQFYVDNRNRTKPEVLERAAIHFAEFANLVRPVLTPDTIIADTIANHDFYIVEDLTRWGLMVCLRISGAVHAVIVPLLESDDSAARFVNFLKSTGRSLNFRYAKFDGVAFQIESKTRAVSWPGSNFTDDD